MGPRRAKGSKLHFQEAAREFAWPRRESKFWVQVTTHGRLAIGARGEEAWGFP